MIKNHTSLYSEIKELPDVFKQSYLPSLDGLRAVSILLVIISHVLVSFKAPDSFYYFANLGVQFFFVISGFLITTLLIKEKVLKGRISLKNFYVRRFFRIIPVAYLYLLAILLLKFVLKLNLDFFLILASFMFIRNFFINTKGVNHLTTHYWSLAVEEQFYLIFPAILKISLKVYINFLIAIIFISILLDFASASLLLKLDQNTFFKILIQLITQFQGITIGSFFSIVCFKKYATFGRVNKNLLNTVMFIGIFLLTTYQGQFLNLANIIKCIFFGVVLVSGLTAGNNLFFKLFNSRAMKLIGVLSFSIYIWQQPFTQNLSFINGKGFMQRFANKVPVEIFIMAISLLLLAAVSYLSYYFYEKKFLKLREKFR